MFATARPAAASVFLVFLVFVIGALGCRGSVSEFPEWTGEGSQRILVEVPPIELGERSKDQMAARLSIDFREELRRLGMDGEADLSSLQVHRYDARTGLGQTFPFFEGARSPYDRPCRFDDDVLPWDYPDRTVRASTLESGRGPAVTRPGGGRIFNREKEPESGYIVWVHDQTEEEPTRYAIYWNVVGKGGSGPSPAPWIGDVDILRRPEAPLGGFSHFSLSAADFNGNGLFDLVAGVEKGDLMWFPNRGRKGHPRFTGARILFDEEGPIDAGWYGSPFIYDWDGDGLPDLLAGTAHNSILWWRNVGSPGEPRLSFMGHVEADGAPLKVPHSPVPEDPTGIFKHDYYNQPWVGDFDGDGIPDILTGGYVTGLIFHYRGRGRDDRGVPILEFVGPLQADGRPIDTIWAAAPTLYDFDGDGRLELITGTWKWSGIHDSPLKVEYLQYYKNAGTRRNPRFERRPFPMEGEFPPGQIARTSLVDWNDNGLPDLLVSDVSGSVRLALNTGSSGSPKWEFQNDSLTVPWGLARMPGVRSLVDSGENGAHVFLAGNAVYRFEGSPHSPELLRLGDTTVDGLPIRHSGPGYGDPYQWNLLWDWDGDGHQDVLSGTQQGNVYFHRNLGRPGRYEFASGIAFKLTSGELLKVGPPVFDNLRDVKNFTDLQGSRIRMAVADFDGDGIQDLAVTETYGNIWIFRNTVAGSTEDLEPGVLVGKLPFRTSLGTFDWNRDGKPDLICGGTVDRPGLLYLNESSPGKLSFTGPLDSLPLPFVFWGAAINAVDWNNDGDEDLLISSEFLLFWAERSFLEHGYRPAHRLDGE